LPSTAITSPPSASARARANSHAPTSRSSSAASILCNTRRSVASLGPVYARRNQFHLAPNPANNDCGRSATCEPICRKFTAPANTATTAHANVHTSLCRFPCGFRGSASCASISNKTTRLLPPSTADAFDTPENACDNNIGCLLF
jgi:hypothetical protein